MVLVYTKIKIAVSFDIWHMVYASRNYIVALQL